MSVRTDCLVALDEGTVDAITADDTILFGFKAQDRNTRILDPALTTEPYGMIIAKGHPDFVRFVNAVLEAHARRRNPRRASTRSGSEHSLARVRPTPVPPAARYQD